MKSTRKFKVDPLVFGTSAAIALAFIGVGIVAPDWAAQTARGAQAFIVDRFGWFYVLSVSFFLAFALWLALGPAARIRLGADADRPEFSTGAWFAMLFSAGMGIGLLFYGVAEPVLHYSSPPVGVGGTPDAAREAMALTFFHWGLHAWGIYVVLGVALAYACFRMGQPFVIRSAFYPLFGERVHGRLGRVIDVLAVVGTLFGLATSLGLGASQINAGLDSVAGVEQSTGTQVVIIAVITLIATASVLTGLDKGIKLLSTLNVSIAGVLLVFVLVAGPTWFLLEAFSNNLGYYLQTLIQRSFWTDPLRDSDWLGNWTYFYWGWWIAWAPFVGMFVARISRGRTIRQFVLGVLFVPTVVTFVWLTVFGNTALHVELFGDGGIATAVNANVSTAIYEMLGRLPWGDITSVIALVVVATFFVTSSDSGSFVVDMLTSGGHPDPPLAQRAFWALAEGAVAIVLLVVGGLATLQTAAITTGLPFCAVLIGVCFALAKAIRVEELRRRQIEAEVRSQAVDQR